MIDKHPVAQDEENLKIRAHFLALLEAGTSVAYPMCAEAIEKSDPSNAKKVFWNVSESFEGLCRRMLAVVEQTLTSIPVPNGFTPNDGERRLAHDAVCALLPALEGYSQELGALINKAEETERLLVATQRQSLSAAWMLSELTARAYPDVLVCTLLQVLNGYRDTTDALAGRIHAMYASMLSLSTRFLPNFAIRVAKKADFSNLGASCDPLSLRRLCGNLCEALKNQL